MKTIFNFARSRSVPLILALLMLVYGTGCRTLIKIKDVRPPRVNAIKKVTKRHFFLHAGINVYELSDPILKNEVLSGNVIIPTVPIYYVIDRDLKYSKDEESILNEVHIFLNPQHSAVSLGQIEIPEKDITQIKVIKKNQSDVIGVTVLTVSLLVLLTTSVLSIEFPPLWR